ncbi:MAG: DUF2169 domain-containing protein [bacterium]
MHIFRPLQLSLNHRVLEQNNKFHFIVSATLGVNLQTGDSLLEFDFIKDALGCMGEKPMPDMGMPKPCGEYLVSGSYFAPRNEAVTGGEVKVKLGAKEKSLFVFGPRQWRFGVPSTPETIQSTPIDYAHAFGGKKYEQNPDGIGFQKAQLPSIENPSQLITSPEDTPEPAGFSVLDPAWPQRMQYQGTYDEYYMKKYFPGYPEDLDWRYFLSAPKDQWIDGYFQGNETFELFNMHPDKPVIRGQLPGLYSRCFIRHTINSTEPIFAELPLNLDTIWFFPEKELAMLILRGGIVVADDEADQVSDVLMAYEDRKDPPRSPEHYRKALERRLNSDDALLNNLNTEDLIPIGAKCAMELLQQMAQTDGNEIAFAKNIEAKADSLKKMADGKIEVVIKDAEKQMKGPDVPDAAKVDLRKMIKEPSEAPTDPDLEAMNQKMESILPGITAGDPKKIELKNFSFDKIDQLMETVGDFSDKKEKEAKDLAKKEIKKVKTQVKEQIEKSGDDMPKEAREKLEGNLQMLDNIDIEEKPIAPLPRVNPEEITAQVSQGLPQNAEVVQHLQGMKAMGIENEQTSNLEEQFQEMMENQNETVEKALHQAEKDFKEVYFMGAHFMEDGLSPHKKPLETVAQDLLDAIAGKEDVSEKDWACIDLSGKNLDGVNLSGAYLEQVNFKGASLKGANLSKAILARANLEDADLSGANLEEANVGAVHALRANFSGAKLKLAKLSKGDFTDADFKRSQLEEVESLEIVVNGTNFSEAEMPKMVFLEVDMKCTNFSKAKLDTVTFLKSTITDANFSEAHMPRCTWADVKLVNVTFNGADMTGNCFVSTDPEKSVMKDIRFVGACLNKANFQGMAMQKANLSGATMENANFNSADLFDADLSHAQAANAQFRKARLTRAKCDRINLMEGSLAKAHLVSASFVGANLYAVDFIRSTHGGTDFSGSNLDSTLIKDWRPS